METQMHNLETLLEWLRHRAAERRAPLIFQLRISVTPERTQLLDLLPEQSIATISF